MVKAAGLRKKGSSSISPSRATTAKQVCDQRVLANSSFNGCNSCGRVPCTTALTKRSSIVKYLTYLTLITLEGMNIINYMQADAARAYGNRNPTISIVDS